MCPIHISILSLYGCYQRVPSSISYFSFIKLFLTKLARKKASQSTDAFQLSSCIYHDDVVQQSDRYWIRNTVETSVLHKFHLIQYQCDTEQRPNRITFQVPTALPSIEFLKYKPPSLGFPSFQKQLPSSQVPNSS